MAKKVFTLFAVNYNRRRSHLLTVAKAGRIYRKDYQAENETAFKKETF